MKDDRDLFYSVAVMYYTDGLNQEEISKRLNISRPMVSRILTKAQECGIVEVKINKPTPLANLASDLEERYNLKKVYIAPNRCGLKDVSSNVSDDIAEYSSQLMIQELCDQKNIGVGWGYTIYKTVMRMVETNTADYSFSHNVVPIVGSIGVREAHYQVNIIVSLLSHVLGGSVYFYNSAESEREDFKERYESLFSLWENLDAVVFGLGPYPNRRSFPNGVIDENQNSGLLEYKAVGDVLGRFFSKDGIISNEWGEGYLGLSLESLLGVKKRMCLCGGPEKIDAIKAAANLGLFNILVTDTHTAEQLMK